MFWFNPKTVCVLSHCLSLIIETCTSLKQAFDLKGWLFCPFQPAIHYCILSWWYICLQFPVFFSSSSLIPPFASTLCHACSLSIFINTWDSLLFLFQVCCCCCYCCYCCYCCSPIPHTHTHSDKCDQKIAPHALHTANVWQNINSFCFHSFDFILFFFAELCYFLLHFGAFLTLYLRVSLSVCYAWANYCFFLVVFVVNFIGKNFQFCVFCKRRTSEKSQEMNDFTSSFTDQVLVCGCVCVWRYYTIF